MRDFYSLCRRTVTVYRRTADGVERTVFPRAYLDRTRSRSVRVSKTRTVDAIGAQEAGEVLLVIPGPVQAVYPGDKVLPGVGPEVRPEDWAGFIPAAVPGLSVITWARPMYFRDKMVHTEAG